MFDLEINDPRFVFDEDTGDFTVSVDTERYSGEVADMLAFMNATVIGQPLATDQIAKFYSLAQTGLRSPNQPAGVYVFSGPTGVGKTLTAESLARYAIYENLRDSLAILRTPRPLTYLEGERLSEKSSKSQLIGAGPSYIGSDRLAPLSQLAIDGPAFWATLRSSMTPDIEREIRAAAAKERETKAERGKPTHLDQLVAELHVQTGPHASFVLFDEVEKAHEEVHDYLLTMLDGGYAGMADGSTTDLRNTHIFLTTNLGGFANQKASKGRSGKVGFGASKDDRMNLDDPERMIAKHRQNVIEAVQSTFKPELVARMIDNIVVFKPLTRQESFEVLLIGLRNLDYSLSLKRFRIGQFRYSKRLLEFLLDVGCSVEYGARFLPKMIEKHVSAKASRALSSGEISHSDDVLVDVVGDFSRDADGKITSDSRKVVFRKKPRSIILVPS